MVPAERVLDGVAPPSSVADDQRVVVRERVRVEVRDVVALGDAEPEMVRRPVVHVGSSLGASVPALSPRRVPPEMPASEGDADRERERPRTARARLLLRTHGAGPDWRWPRLALSFFENRC